MEQWSKGTVHFPGSLWLAFSKDSHTFKSRSKIKGNLGSRRAAYGAWVLSLHSVPLTFTGIHKGPSIYHTCTLQQRALLLCSHLKAVSYPLNPILCCSPLKQKTQAVHTLKHNKRSSSRLLAAKLQDQILCDTLSFQACRVYLHVTGHWTGDGHGKQQGWLHPQSGLWSCTRSRETVTDNWLKSQQAEVLV